MGAWTSPHNTITVAWVGNESFRSHKSRRYSEWRNRLTNTRGASISRPLSDDTCRLDFVLYGIVSCCGIKTSTAVDIMLVKKYDLATKKILWVGTFIGLFLVWPTFLLSCYPSVLMTTQLTMDLALSGDHKVADRLSIENNYIYYVSLT